MLFGTSRRGRLLAACAAVSAFAAPVGALAQDHEDEASEVEEIVIQATRSGRVLENQPIRVEVIPREEIEEKILMNPGNIATLVAETGGVRVQVTSPSLGASSIRIQGMRGRYTQVLSDGLPLNGGQASSLGLLQIPPSDLGQVEVIKGAASALYGPSALGGVINLVSRRPRLNPEAEILLNATSRDGQDLTAYLAAPGETAGYSITGGAHRQSAQDLDGDGWLDTPAYDRWLLRPRLFWEGPGGARAYATLGMLDEERVGGTAAGRTAPDGKVFVQAQDTQRFDGGATFEIPLGIGLLRMRGSGVTQRHNHRFGDVAEDDRHETRFAEASLSGGPDGTSWLVGLAAQHDAYRNRAFPVFDYDFDSPALFAQVEHDLSEDLTVAASARFDVHSAYGDQFSPRLSLLFRPKRWTFRASIGRGFYAPTPFVEEIEATGLARLQPLTGLLPETAETASLEAGYRAGRLEANLTVFGSNIHDAVRLESAGPQQVRLVNVVGDTRTSGVEGLLRYRQGEITVTGSYVYVDATEPSPAGGGRRITPVTPRHTAGMVAMWENHDRGRVGLEVYYTGTQRLKDNPHRATSRPYLEVGLLGELVVGKARLFLNLENILDVRQTNYDPMLLPTRGPAGEWTVDAWAPPEGFVVNGGLRLWLGGS